MEKGPQYMFNMEKGILWTLFHIELMYCGHFSVLN